MPDDTLTLEFSREANQIMLFRSRALFSAAIYIRVRFQVDPGWFLYVANVANPIHLIPAHTLPLKEHLLEVFPLP